MYKNITATLSCTYQSWYRFLPTWLVKRILVNQAIGSMALSIEHVAKGYKTRKLDRLGITIFTKDDY